MADWTEVFARAPFMRWLGVDAASTAPGRVEATLRVRPELLQQDGFVHAGVQTALADHTAGAAAATLTPAGKTVLSIELKINMLRPATGQLLRCVAEVLRAGRTVTVVESSVYAEEKLVAKATVTLAVVDIPVARAQGAL